MVSLFLFPSASLLLSAFALNRLLRFSAAASPVPAAMATIDTAAIHSPVVAAIATIRWRFSRFPLHKFAIQRHLPARNCSDNL
jgi:hypothetical protein